MCLSRPPIRRSYRIIMASVWAMSGRPPKNLRRRYAKTDSPAISACCSRRAFSSGEPRTVTQSFDEETPPPSALLFLPFMRLAFGMREAKRRAFRESRGRQPSGRMVVVCHNYHPASKNPCRRVVTLYVFIFLVLRWLSNKATQLFPSQSIRKESQGISTYSTSKCLMKIWTESTELIPIYEE